MHTGKEAIVNINSANSMFYDFLPSDYFFSWITKLMFDT